MSTEETSRIRQLPTAVINKIAAGEVIERPASVVKEMLENSVDALSTKIEVDIEEGGAELIRIVDNGEGIHPDDVLLSVASHATSKLVDADDLFNVQTMGFRGEALASISEVSHFRLRTKQRDQAIGTELEVHGGVIQPLRACGCPDGTQIEIRQLFFNTPVRRKFLKTPSTEFAHISEHFTRIAIAYPNLQMTLRHNGKIVHELPPTHQLIERLELFFGSELARQLISVEASHGGARIWGFVGHPSQNKGTRKGQYLFLNGRCIQDRSLQHALGEAYRGLVMVGRYPVAFLFLEIPPDQVDVNVHPTKAEVRFQDSQVLYRLLLSTLRNKFLSMDLDSKLSIGTPGGPAGRSAEQDEAPFQQQELVSWVASSLDQQHEKSSPAARLPLQEHIPPFAKYPELSRPIAESGSDAEFTPFAIKPELAERLPAPPPVTHVETIEAQSKPASAAAEVRAMQVHDCYLVVETTEGITVIDQHALHERIMYEQLRKRVLSGGIEVQRLLIPLLVELSTREVGILMDQIDVLSELGIQLQEFGGNTVALCGYPTLLAKADPAGLLKSVVELIETSSRRIERRDLIDSLLHMMSCKAAIKAGQRLSIEEMEALLAQRHLCDDAHHCPHGRPTALKLSRDELDRQFGRLGS
ncbi:DNA mismatch repair endonuclease MutL [Planctomicrobium sp. SH668]|uniref:DNA mismatch repair endonuclease MutL n=1 Tax=Planctomicrobium sp. SH668 TaxID=3448126 RepID=UPI003F5B7E22